MADQYQYVKLPNGEYGKFASDASDSVIKSAIQKDFPTAFAPNAGLSAPPGVETPPELRGMATIGATPEPKSFGQRIENAAASAVGDVQYGTGNTWLGKVFQKMGAQGTRVGSQAPAGDFMGSPVTGALNTARGVGITAQPGRRGEGLLETAKGAAEAGTIPGLVVGGPAVAEAAPVAAEAVGSQAAKVFGSTSRAAEKFQQVMSKARDIPINTDAVSEVAMRTDDLAKSGGSMPKVVRDFIKRATDPSKGAVTYQEARDFYSNATRLSGDEFNRLTPVMRRQVGEFTQKLGAAIGQAAGQVGEAGNYGQAVDLYRKAKKTEAVVNGLAKSAGNYVVKPAVYGAVGGGIGGGIAKMLMNK
jgi:hypothetical protein